MHQPAIADRAIWYCSQSVDLTHPVDRRRFAWWAQRRVVDFKFHGSRDGTDLVVLTPMGDFPYWVRQKEKRSDVRIVLDMVDGYLTAEEAKWRGWLRSVERVYSNRFSPTFHSYHHWLLRVLETADSVIVGSPEQEQEVSAYSPNVFSVPDWHGEYPSLRIGSPAESPLTFLWEGQSVTLKHLESLMPVLEEAAGQVGQVKILIVSAESTPRLGDRYFPVSTRSGLAGWGSSLVHVEFIPWSTQAVACAAQRAHLAVIPISQGDRFAQLKPENKLLIYWRLGLPSLTSPTPAYMRVMDSASVPGICWDDDEWLHKVLELAGSPTARASHVAHGKEYLSKHHQDDQLLQVWDTAMANAVAHR